MIVLREERLQPTPITLSSPPYMLWVRFNQYLLLSLWRVVTRTLIVRHTTFNLELSDLNDEFRYVIAANHQSQIDTFVICQEFSLTIWRRLKVFRVLVYDKVFRNPATWALMVAIGGFPAKPARNMPYGLEATRAFLGREQTIMIFPEARRSLPRETKPHAGVAVLAADPNIRIIPVHIQWHKNGWRRSYQMTVGKPLPTELSAQEIMDAIYQLPLV